jgi:hypothetical protein
MYRVLRASGHEFFDAQMLAQTEIPRPFLLGSLIARS